jgi:RNA 3'-terminal phosphate cyclase
MWSVERDASKLLQEGSNGSENASFEIRKASQSHAFDSPVPGEGRSPNGPADEELKMLNWTAENLHIRGLSGEFGPGNALTLTVEHEHVTEVFTGFGEKGVSAESVAKRAVYAARNYLASEAPVGQHLADQLLLPMALAGGGEFTTMPVTQHFESHVEIVEKFLARRVVTESLASLVHVRVR